VFSKVFNALHECGILPSAHVSSEWACQQHVEEQETFLKWYSIALLLACKDFLHILVFHEHACGELCMMMACTHFTHSVCKIYTQGTVPCVWNFVIGYTLITIASSNTICWWSYFHP
jgi:hypothetical protein